MLTTILSTANLTGLRTVFGFGNESPGGFEKDSLRTISAGSKNASEYPGGKKKKTVVKPSGSGAVKNQRAALMAEMRTDGGEEYPQEAYAYVPDLDKPSTWKLRLWETPEKKTTAAQVGRALAAIGPGFRGQRVQIPADDRPSVLKKIKTAWNKTHPDAKDEDVPGILKKKTFTDDSPAEDFALHGYHDGIRFRVGRRLEEELFSFQAVDFSKDVWELSEALRWLKDNSFWNRGFEEIGNSWRFHMEDDKFFEPGSLKFIEIDPNKMPEKIESPKEVRFSLDEIVFAKDEKDDQELFSVKGIEIFRTGTWNGDVYTRKDLDEMVRNFKKVGFQVPIKLGHKESSGSPAFGWVEHIKRTGDKLIANFKDLPKKLWKALKDRRFDTVSSEVFWNLERDGKKFRRVLKAVALLGAETPAVSGLAPLRTAVNTVIPPESGFDRIGAYSFQLKEEDDEMDKLEELKEQVQGLQEELEAATAALAEAKENVEKANKGKQEEEAAAELQEAQDKVKQLQDGLDAAQEKIEHLVTDQDRKIAELEKTVDDLTSKLGDMSEERRQDRIKKKVESVPIPALRRFIEPLYDMATSTAKTVEFSVMVGDGDEAKEETQDVPIEQVVDAFVAHLNSEGHQLFREFSEAANKERPEGEDPHAPFAGDPASEADKRARKYMDESKEEDYSTAVKHVLDEDAKLKQAYAEFDTAPSRH